MWRAFCATIVARLARFLIELHHYPLPNLAARLHFIFLLFDPSSQTHDDRKQRQHQHHLEHHVNIDIHNSLTLAGC
jgi:hypothetical protein